MTKRWSFFFSSWIACHQPTSWTVINVDSPSNTMATITRALQPQEPVSRQSSAGHGLAPTVTLQRFVCLYQNITAHTWRVLWGSYPADRNMHNIFRSLKGFMFQISITCYLCEQGWTIHYFYSGDHTELRQNAKQNQYPKICVTVVKHSYWMKVNYGHFRRCKTNVYNNWFTVRYTELWLTLLQLKPNVKYHQSVSSNLPVGTGYALRRLKYTEV